MTTKTNLWFETNLTVTNFNPSTNTETAQRLAQIFRAIFDLNPKAFVSTGLEFSSHLEFPQNWGLGSSSTLVNNLAQWANVDAFALLENTFGGSGYDIACAQNAQPIVYQRQNSTPLIKIVDFDPPFKDQLFFVHRNQKQNSREAIARYNTLKTTQTLDFSALNAITEALLVATTLEEFEVLISKHENLVGRTYPTPPIKNHTFCRLPRSGKKFRRLGW